MNWMPAAVRSLGISMAALTFAGAANVSDSYAETYIAGQFGITFPSLGIPSLGNGLSDGNLTTTSLPVQTGTLNIPSGATISDQELKTSYLYGGKIGHYFSRARWFGIEAEIFYGTPHIKQQNLTIRSETPMTLTPSGGGPSTPAGYEVSGEIPGAHFQVLTIAPLNVMFRYPGKRLQPYIGAGPGIFIAQIKDHSVTEGDNTQSSMKFGLNALVGIRYYLTRHVSAFAEGKFNYVRFSFKENPNLFGFDATYFPIHGSFGLSVHF